MDPEFKPGCLTPDPIHFIVPSPQSILKYRYAKIYLFIVDEHVGWTQFFTTSTMLQ